MGELHDLQVGCERLKGVLTRRLLLDLLEIELLEVGISIASIHRFAAR